MSPFFQLKSPPAIEIIEIKSFRQMRFGFCCIEKFLRLFEKIKKFNFYFLTNFKVLVVFI